jgi:hypothetical protein
MEGGTQWVSLPSDTQEATWLSARGWAVQPVSSVSRTASEANGEAARPKRCFLDVLYFLLNMSLSQMVSSIGFSGRCFVRGGRDEVRD